MYQIGLATPYWLIVLMWVARIAVLVSICSLLAWLGIRALDALTPDIKERERIGESPLATGLFIAGFFILVGLVIHGAATAYTAVPPRYPS
jgi:cytochrome c biogenesis protein CcdA